MGTVELMRGYKVCVETCMGVKPGENVLIVTDLDNMDRAEALASASYMAGAEPLILVQPSAKKFSIEPPEMVAECMKKADVIFVSLPFLYAHLFFHTQARKDALKAGARLGNVWLTPENADITKEEIYETRERSEKMADMLTKAEKLRVRTKKGTDITMDVKGRTSFMLSSLLDKPGDSGAIPNFAEAAVAPIEGSAEGRVVIDASMYGVGLVKDPIIWEVKKGRVVEISGKEEAQKLKDLLERADTNSTNIAELGVGTVPRGEIVGSEDDKKLLGTGHIGIGDNRFGGGNVASDVHLDCVFRDMTLELDGKVIMEDGVLKAKL